MQELPAHRTALDWPSRLDIVSLTDQLNELWGGIVDSITLDLAAHRAEIRVHTLEFGKVTHYRLTFSGVTDFHFSDHQSAKWNYVELTSISSSFLIDESVSTVLVLWDEASPLVIRSLTIAVEDVTTSGGAESWGSSLD